MPKAPLPTRPQAPPERAKAIAATGTTASVIRTRTVPLSIAIVKE
jgi:hypothetical protein